MEIGLLLDKLDALCCAISKMSGTGGDGCCEAEIKILESIKTTLLSLIKNCTESSITHKTGILKPIPPTNDTNLCSVIPQTEICSCTNTINIPKNYYLEEDFNNPFTGTTVQLLFKIINELPAQLGLISYNVVIESLTGNQVFSGVSFNDVISVDLGQTDTFYKIILTCQFAGSITTEIEYYIFLSTTTNTAEYLLTYIESSQSTNIINCSEIPQTNVVYLWSSSDTGHAAVNGSIDFNNVNLFSFTNENNFSCGIQTLATGLNEYAAQTNFDNGLITKNIIHYELINNPVITWTDASVAFLNNENSIDSDINSAWILDTNNDGNFYSLNWEFYFGGFGELYCQGSTPQNHKIDAIQIDYSDFDLFGVGDTAGGVFILFNEIDNTIYGIEDLNDLPHPSIGISTLTITPFVPLLGTDINHLKLMFAFSGVRISINDVRLVQSWDCITAISHKVLEVKPTCLPEGGLPVNIRNSNLATEQTLQNIDNRFGAFQTLINRNYNFTRNLIIDSSNSQYTFYQNTYHAINIKAFGATCTISDGSTTLQLADGETYNEQLTERNQEILVLEVSNVTDKIQVRFTS